MSADFHVKATGITGESEKKGHEKQVDIESWSWSCSNASSARSGGGSGTGQAVAGDLLFMSRFSVASPNFAQRCASGNHIDELKLSGRKAGAKDADYFVLTLSHVFVTSVSYSGADNGDILESVSCSCKKIKFEYKVQNNKGELGAGSEFTWDVEKGEAKN